MFHATTSPDSRLILSFPHSGEIIPREAIWLKDHSKLLLLSDVDRFVDQLYEPTVLELNLFSLKTDIHRYAVDLNRVPTDVDATSVEGVSASSPPQPHGFHWVKTMEGKTLLHLPLPRELHEHLVKKYHDSFHKCFQSLLSEIRLAHPGEDVIHLDCHSMPSVSTREHKDFGEVRKDVVLSDFNGKSCDKKYMAALVSAFEQEGFSVSVNWPYAGGRITQSYGKPNEGHHTIQIELNRALYLNEKTKRKKLKTFGEMQVRMRNVIAKFHKGL